MANSLRYTRITKDQFRSLVLLASDVFAVGFVFNPDAGILKHNGDVISWQDLYLSLAEELGLGSEAYCLLRASRIVDLDPVEWLLSKYEMKYNEERYRAGGSPAEMENRWL